MKGWAVTIIIVIIIALGTVFYLRGVTPPEVATPINNVPITTPGDATSTPNDNDFVQLVSVKGGDVIKSPLTVTGEARGTWFFEASFPIKIRDEYGNVLAAVPAQAQGEWMTTNFVPFSATINFTAPATTTRGFLVLEKDNPSGDPERDQAIIIPIRFK